MNSKLLCIVSTLTLLSASCGGASQTALPYPIVDSGQDACYDNHHQIAPPQLGDSFYGQDAQHSGNQPSYTLSADGLTVQDNITGLVWQRSPDTNGDGKLTYADKMTLEEARKQPEKLNATNFGGYHDWHLPTIKELYSLINFKGGCTGREADSIPYIDTRYFTFAYGQADAGERVIDSQYASSTVYVSSPNRKMFGVNFADGRIKGYDTVMPGGRQKEFWVMCVRGNPDYGKNDFHDNGDGTISDRATGLMWSQTDSGVGMDWQAALAWVQQMNAEKHLDYSDWRLPNAKELESIVDYSRAPGATNSSAIDPIFQTTRLSDGDYPYFWSSTTHLDGPPDLRGTCAVYVAFGRASGWMKMPPHSGNLRLVDVHGAGAQRSDPKAGDPADFPHGRGPQGDVIRINNFVRLVRDIP